MGWARQQKGLAWMLLGVWCVLTGLMADWAARPAYFQRIRLLLLSMHGWA